VPYLPLVLDAAVLHEEGASDRGPVRHTDTALDHGLAHHAEARDAALLIGARQQRNALHLR
jgi:hypothetical protein